MYESLVPQRDIVPNPNNKQCGRLCKSAMGVLSAVSKLANALALINEPLPEVLGMVPVRGRSNPRTSGCSFQRLFLLAEHVHCHTISLDNA